MFVMIRSRVFLSRVGNFTTFSSCLSCRLVIFCLVKVTTDDESTVSVFSLQGHCSVGKVVHQEVFCGCFGWVVNHCDDQGGHLTRQTVGPQHKPDALQLLRYIYLDSLHGDRLSDIQSLSSSLSITTSEMNSVAADLEVLFRNRLGHPCFSDGCYVHIVQFHDSYELVEFIGEGPSV